MAREPKVVELNTVVERIRSDGEYIWYDEYERIPVETVEAACEALDNGANEVQLTDDTSIEKRGDDCSYIWYNYAEGHRSTSYKNANATGLEALFEMNTDADGINVIEWEETYEPDEFEEYLRNEILEGGSIDVEVTKNGRAQITSYIINAVEIVEMVESDRIEVGAVFDGTMDEKGAVTFRLYDTEHPNR